MIDSNYDSFENNANFCLTTIETKIWPFVHNCDNVYGDLKIYLIDWEKTAIYFNWQIGYFLFSHGELSPKYPMPGCKYKQL